jgi:serine/threonine-protein kinase
VSRGPKPVTLPDVTGVPYLQAESVLRGQGFTVSRVDVQSDQQPKGVVVSMDPPQGTDVPAGSKITLSVSSGPATSQIPDVTNQTQADASRILKAAGFTVGLVMEPVTDPSQDGIVVSQDPVGGSTGQQGEVVVITVGQLQTTTTLP